MDTRPSWNWSKRTSTWMEIEFLIFRIPRKIANPLYTKGYADKHYLGGGGGDKGDKCDTGPQGDKGDTGPQRPKSDKGDTGPQGP